MKKLLLAVGLLAALGAVALFGFMRPHASATLVVDETEVHTSEQASFRVEVFAEGFEVPWGMAFLPDGRLLVTERPGRIRIVSTDGAVSEPIGGAPEVWADGQGGLLDIALHPDYASNGWIYLTFSDPAPDEDGAFTALARARLDGAALVDYQLLYRAPEDVYSSRGQHFGSRIVFDDAGYVFFGIGDRGRREQAQELSVPNGKIHRLHDDGRIPADNPFVDTPGAVASIWSYGHRNPQGMAVHPETGEIWETEHGPRGGDELNHIRKGLNYGWPVITYGINYSGTKITDLTEKEGMEQPATHWTPSIALCGIGFYTGDAFPEWRNDLFVTSLKFGQLHRVEIEDGAVVGSEIAYEPGTRLRDVQAGPDGLLYLAMEGTPGQIVRLRPDRDAGIGRPDIP